MQNKYEIINTIVSFDFIANESFEHIFAKYIVSSDSKANITFTSKYVDKIEIKEEDVSIKGPGYLVGTENGEGFYILSERNKHIGKIIGCDYSGKYRVEVLMGANPYYVEYVMLQCGLSRYFALHKNAMFIHASAISYKGKAIMFSAPSGTGKSTHSRLWKEYYDVKYVNDDKNFVILEDDKLYVYGTPISGKHQLDNNIKSELIGLVFLKQAPYNKITKLNKMSAFMQLFNQIQRPEFENDMNKLMPIIDKIIDFPCYQLECTISKEAVDLVKKEYFGGNDDED